MLRPSPKPLTLLRRALLGCAMVGLLSSTSTVSADTCVGTDPETGSCSLTARDYPGEYPYAMTVASTNSTLYVADLFSGLYYTFDSTNLATPATPVPVAGPLGPATYTGMAWNPVDDRLYWLVEGTLGPELVVSGLFGEFISSTPLMSPNVDGFLSGLGYAPDTDSFWTFDILNDEILNFDATGAFIPANTIQSPGTSAFGGASYGLGLTVVPADNIIPTIDYDLHVAVGYSSDLRAQRIERLDADDPSNAVFGMSYELDGSNDLTGWITGLAYNPTVSPASQFVADVTSSTIIEVPSPTLTVGSITDLTCVAAPNDDVTLSWNLPNLTTYTNVSISRDGQVLQSLAPSITTFTETDVEAGVHTYSIRVFTNGSTQLPPRTCSVVVGFGRVLNTRAHDGDGAFAVTVIEGTNQVLVADLDGGSAFLYPKDLSTAGQPMASPFSGQTAGVTWNSTDNSLLWHDGAGTLQKTDLAGTLIGTAITLSPMPLEPTGDISYSVATNSYFGISVTGAEYFEFLDDGSVIGTCALPSVGGEPGAFGQGVAVAGTTLPVILDAPIGSLGAGKVDRVLRLTDCVDSGLFYEVTPSTLSGAIAGVAWTPAGSTGFASEYLIGYDTNTIYEVSLDLSSVGDDFQRGDVDIDGTRNISDAVNLLLYLFSGGDLTCLDAGDTNDDGALDTADVVTLLTFLFQGGLPMAEPFDCGSDPTIDSQVCDTYGICP